MDGMRLDWRGEEVLEKVKKLTEDKLKELAENTVGIAKSEHPYKNRTGTNTASITWDEKEGKFRVYTQSGYGAWLELGTAKMPAFPYILPAFQKATKEMEDDLEDSI